MQELFNAVDKHRQLILDTERYIWNNPETGFKEEKTNRYMVEQFEKLGYELTLADGITGFYTLIDTGRPGPEILIMGELDSVICPSHPNANPETGAVHSCGHNAQCAALLGIAAALKEPGILDKFCGRIRLAAVPAEELLELGYRRELREQGKIKYFGGKTEFLSRGYFDGADIALLVHTSGEFGVGTDAVGCMVKNVRYKGVAAHAGACPWDGKNALYAANCGLNAINAIRETFKEEDVIRVHPIITQGGAMVNAIPEEVVLESYIRGASYDGIIDANKRVNRALCGAALSLGANVEIIDIPGYAPLKTDRNLLKLSKETAMLFMEEDKFFVNEKVASGSSDMGDLSCIMPTVQPYAGGAVGNGHGNNYYITDPERACVISAKWQLVMVLKLLEEDAKLAKKVIQEFKPVFASKEAYLSYVDKINDSGDRIEYREGEGAFVRL